MKGPRGIPRCPAGLDKLAKQCQELLEPVPPGPIGAVADDGVAVDAGEHAHVHEHGDQLVPAKNGEVYPIRDGNGKVKCVTAFPQVSIVNKLGLALTKLEQEFGMTPSARSRLQCELQAEEPQTIEELLRHRMIEERFFKKPAHGLSARDALEILATTPKPEPRLKIARDPPQPSPANPDGHGEEKED